MARHDRQLADLIRLSDKRVPSVLTASQRGRFARFLSFAIEDGTGQASATLLSLFSRMGMEPWDEAQALSTMPEHAATGRLAWLISSTTSNAQADAELVARHLLTLLPVQAATGQAGYRAVVRRCGVGLVLAFALAWLVSVRGHPQPPGLQEDQGTRLSQHQPGKHEPAGAPQRASPIR